MGEPTTFGEWWDLNGGATEKDDVPPSDWDHDNSEAAYAAGVASQQPEIERLNRELEDRPDSGGLARLHALENVVRAAKRAIALIMSQPGEFTTDEVGLDDLLHAIAELDRLTGERQ